MFPTVKLILPWPLPCADRGRYVATSVTSVHQTENGFNVWSFLGKLLYALPYERFYQVRPGWVTLSQAGTDRDTPGMRWHLSSGVSLLQRAQHVTCLRAAY